MLLGYALMGKGFAYLGFPPLYVGEIAFLTGIVVFLRTGAFVGALTTLPALLLVALMAWVLARTLPFVGLYGFDSLRDSVVVIYGGFAFIVIGLLLEDARRINTVLRYYGIMLASFPAIPVGFWLTKYWGDYIPRLYGPVPIVEIGASAVGTHLAGAMVFVLIGYRKVSLPLGSCLVHHAGFGQCDQSRRDARRHRAGRDRDARARTVPPDAHHRGGGRGHIRRSSCILESTFGELRGGQGIRSSARSARTRSSRMPRASLDNPASKRKAPSSGV